VQQKIKTILITGASGYLGRNLSKYFIKKKFKIYAISKKKISNTVFLGSSLKKNNIRKTDKFDLIIHCAAKGVYKNEKKKIYTK
jgi:dTDP-4-dehydrorhamnose reductase